MFKLYYCTTLSSFLEKRKYRMRESFKLLTSYTSYLLDIYSFFQRKIFNAYLSNECELHNPSLISWRLLKKRCRLVEPKWGKQNQGHNHRKFGRWKCQTPLSNPLSFEVNKDDIPAEQVSERKNMYKKCCTRGQKEASKAGNKLSDLRAQTL